MFFLKKPPCVKLLQIFSPEECNIIRNDFEKNKKHIKLSKEHGVSRISSYEIDSKNLSKQIVELIENKINEKIRPITKGKKGMVFGVRYTMETKSYMTEHYDCNSYSCVISLNNDFLDGGTYFPFSGEIIKPHTGWGCLFKADKLNSYHAAYPITDGVRDVLVIRMQRGSFFKMLLNAIFLHFFDKYIQRNKEKYFQKPKLVDFQ